MNTFIKRARLYESDYYECTNLNEAKLLLERIHRRVKLNLVYVEDSEFEWQFVCVRNIITLFIIFGIFPTENVKKISALLPHVEHVLTNRPSLFQTNIDIYACAIHHDLNGVLNLPAGFSINCRSTIEVQEVFDFFIKYRREFKTLYQERKLWIGNNVMLNQVVYIIHVLEIYPDVLSELVKLIL